MPAGVERIAVRVLFEGLEVPAGSVSISAGVNGPATAHITMLPHDTLFQLRPRTQVLIFYLSPQNNPDPAELSPTRRDAQAMRHWRLLFAGETYSGGEMLSGGSRSYAVQARAHIGGLAREFLFTTTFSAAGDTANPTVISDRSRFFGTLSGSFDNIINDPATVIERIYMERKTLSPNLKDVQGPLAGLLTLYEWQVGVHGTFAGANDFATVWGRISRLLDQIVSDRGVAAEALFGANVFTKWLKNNLSDLGKVVSLETVSKMVQEFIQYEMIPCPVAMYTPGSNAKPVVSIPAPTAPAGQVGTTSPSPVVVGNGTASSSAEIDLATLNGADKSLMVPTARCRIQGMTHVAIWYVCRLLAGLKAAGRPAVMTSGFRTEEDYIRIYGVKPSAKAKQMAHMEGRAADLNPMRMLSGKSVVGLGFNSSFGRGDNGMVILSNGAGSNPTTGIWERAKWAAILANKTGRPLQSLVGTVLRGRYGLRTRSGDIPTKITNSEGKEVWKSSVYLAVVPDMNGEPLGNAVFTAEDYAVMDDLSHFFKLIVKVIDSDPVLRAGLTSGAREGFGLYQNPNPDVSFAHFGVLGADPVHVQVERSTTIPSKLPTGRTTVTVPGAGSLERKVPAPPDTLPPVTNTSALLTAPPAAPPPPDKTEGPRARLHSNLFLPDTWFCAPPVCNVIFREEISSLSSSNAYLDAVTRLELETHNVIRDEAAGASAGTLSLRDVYFAPQLQTANSPNGQVVSNLTSGGLQTTVNSDGSDRAMIYQHEKFGGIVPRQEFFGDYAISAVTEPTAAAEGISSDEAYSRLASAIAAWNFMRARSESFSLTVELKFTPRLVVGLPAVVIRKSREDGTGLPLCYIGKITGLSHTITDTSAQTSVTLSYVRMHRQESVKDDLFAGGLRLREQRPGSIYERTIPLFQPMTSADADFLTRIKALEASGAIEFPLSTPEVAGTTRRYEGGQLAGLKSPSGGEVTSLTLKPIPAQQAKTWPGDAVYPPDLGGIYNKNGLLVVGRNVHYIDAGGAGDEASLDASEDAAAQTPSSGGSTPVNTSGPLPPPTAPPPNYAAIKEAPNPEYDYIYSVIYTEQRNTVGVPLEEAIRPAWMGDDYSNPNIGAKIYQPTIGCASIIDRISGNPLRAEYAMHCIEDAVDDLTAAYLSASGNGFLAPDWIRQTTERPVATMADLIGSGAFFEFSSGDHDPLVGLDLETPLLVRARLFLGTNQGGASGAATGQGGVVGAQGNGAVQCDPAIDPRRERYKYVRAYVAATGARPGMMG